MKRITSFILIIVTLISCIPFTVFAETEKEEPLPYMHEMNWNKGRVHFVHQLKIDETGHHYNYIQQQSSNSYLFSNSEGLVRVEHAECLIEEGETYCVIEQYDNDFNLLYQKIIKDELPLFGGVFSGENYYFIIYGQKNTEMDDNKEVIRVVKYDKSWNRLDSGSVLGNITQSFKGVKTPFYASNVSLAEYGDSLIIRTARLMYNGHQANLTFKMDQKTMRIEPSSSVYASHSFTQLICQNNENSLMVDLSDGYPYRGINVSLVDQSADKVVRDPYHVGPIFTFKGDTGNNHTGAYLADTTFSDSNYFVLFTSVEQNDKWNQSKDNPYNVYLSVLNADIKNALNSAVKITDYKQDEPRETITINPYLIKFDNNHFMAIWPKKVVEDSDVLEHNPSYSMFYLTFDGQGNRTSDIVEFDGKNSNCHPVVKNGKAYWYVTDMNGLTFCCIDADGNYQEHPVVTFNEYTESTDERYVGFKGSYNGKEYDFFIDHQDIPLNRYWEYDDFITESRKNKWIKKDDGYHYYNECGSDSYGFCFIDDDLYYFNDNGVLQTGWITDFGNRYYADQNGIIQYEWQTIDGKRYYFNDAMVTGWQEIDFNWYYFGSDGAMKIGWQTINQKKYFFKASGEMVKWRQKINNKWYYFNGSGIMQTGWIKGGKWFYADKEGVLKTGLQTIGGKVYYFNSLGEMQTGWQKINNKWYYFNKSGDMKKGWLKDGGKYYLLAYADGHMLTGWVKSGGKWYYMNDNGIMRTGWLKDGGKWYYLDSSGAMLANTSRKIGNKTYRFNSSGICTNP